MIDKTGSPMTVEDFQKALQVVRKYRLSGVSTVPPELYVELGNIQRCLEQGLLSLLSELARRGI